MTLLCMINKIILEMLLRWVVVCSRGSTGLVRSTSAFEKPNLRNRKDIFTPSRFTSAVVVKPECKLKKLPKIDIILSLLLLSPGDIGVVYCGGKIRSGQNLQSCVIPVIPGQSTCGVRSNVTKVKDVYENNV